MKNVLLVLLLTATTAYGWDKTKKKDQCFMKYEKNFYACTDVCDRFVEGDPRRDRCYDKCEADWNKKANKCEKNNEETVQ